MSSPHRVALVALVIGGILCSAEFGAAQMPCTETSCRQEFQFLFVKPDGSGGVGQVSLVVEKTGQLTRIPIIGFYESHYGGLGDQWRASAWVAATFAALQGYDVNRRITYTVDRWIDGPSASGALTVALLAAIDRIPLRPQVVMTGTINPDGTIGPVEGVLAKVKAAARFGKEVVVIPAGQLNDDISTEQNAINQRRSQEGKPPLRVVEVQNLFQAYREYTGNTLPRSPTVVDAEGTGQLPDPFNVPLRDLIRLRTAHAELLSQTWDAERPDPAPPRLAQLADDAGRYLAEARQRAGRGQPVPAYEFSIRAIEHYYAAVSCARRLKDDRRPLTFGDLSQAEKTADRVISELKSGVPSSPTEVSMYTELRGMIELTRQYTRRGDQAEESWARARMGSDAAPPATAALDAELSAATDVSHARGRVVGLHLRLTDYTSLWAAAGGTIPKRAINSDAMAALRRLLIMATEANLGYFEAAYGCLRRVDGPCGRGEHMLGYHEVSAMRDILRPSLDEGFSDKGWDRLYLGLALEAYLGSSMLIHGSYRAMLTPPPGTDTAGAAGQNQVELGPMLNWAKLQAAQIVELVDTGTDTRAILPRLHTQMANFLREGSDLRSRLQALALYWRASAHGRLMIAIDGAP